jgi:hypothetical protein
MCGAALEIFQDGKRISEGYSPFTAEEYSPDVPPSVPTPSEETKDISSWGKHHLPLQTPNYIPHTQGFI